jgi:hypothetical protein
MIDFSNVLWLFPVVFALHEFEEWNVVAWYRRNYVDLPPMTDKSARAWLVFISIVGFLVSAAVILPGNLTLAALIILAAAAVIFLNALQHVYWLFYFKQYAPGVVTSILLLIPYISYLAVRSVQQQVVPLWYVVAWLIFVVTGLVQTVKAGNTMTPAIRAVHKAGEALAKRF